MFHFLRKTALYVFALPILFTVLGTAANQAVLYANNDKFPVRVNEVQLQSFLERDENGDIIPPKVLSDGTEMIDNVHCVMTEKTHLNFLADNFDFHRHILSVGDLAIMAGQEGMGLAPYFWGLVLYSRMRRKEEQHY